MRLDKFLSKNGFGTRKVVRGIIKDKHVLVNGQIVTDHGFKLDLQKDEVSVGHDVIEFKENVYYMLNKPKNSISSTESEVYPSVLEYIKDFRNDLIIVGRLDVDTEGLLLITNDGKFSHQVSHGNRNVFKKYHVELVKDFDTSYIKKIEAGLSLNDGVLKPAFVEVVDKDIIHLSISEGKYHQVKRMMHACNNEVKYLKRIQIGNLKLDPSLALGEYRELTENEKNALIEGGA